MVHTVSSLDGSRPCISNKRRWMVARLGLHSGRECLRSSGNSGILLRQFRTDNRLDADRVVEQSLLRRAARAARAKFSLEACKVGEVLAQPWYLQALRIAAQALQV